MQQIGRYEIIAELGKGGMGVVWLANDPLLKRQVAIKSMLPQNQIPEGASEGIILERLKREAQAAAALNHPNIVSIYDVVPTPDSTYIVMEYVEGKTLAGLMTPYAPMDRAISLRILEQCAAALDHAHQKGIVHRDIKPENIMIDAAGNAKITDFGIARRMGSSATLTMGLAVGTLEYMSPQQLGSEAVDGLADQYSLAVVAYKMLTGHPIFDAEHIQSWCYAIATQKPVSASVRQALVPKTVDAVFEKALAKSPKDRYATCSEFVRQLAPAFAVEAPRAKPRRSAAVLAAAVVLGLLSGGAYLSRRSSPEPKPDPQVQPTAAPTVKPEPVAVATPLPSPTPKSTPAPTPPPVVKATPAVKPAPEEPAARPAAPSTGQVWRNPKDLLNYVWIPPGRFWMGCSPGDRECLPLERPVRDTEISEGFWLSQTEVTVGAWKLFVKSSGRMMPKPIEVQGFVINPGWAADDLPIMSVQWDLAAAFCEWTGGRLPSDSEWEYAARAGVRAPRYGILGDIAWYGGNSGTLPLDDWDPATVDAAKLAQRLTANKNTPHPVGQKQPNAWKLHDMLGNAWEWTADSVERRSVKKKANAGAGDIVHLLRGGSFVAPARQERASVRLRGAGPSLRFAGIGCRCALD